MKFKVDIWHNILWSNYKGGVFSNVHRQAVKQGIEVRFFQIAETENNRRGLSQNHFQYHNYPYTLLAKGSYQDIPTLLLARSLFTSTLYSDADILVIAGYHRIEYWAQLVAAHISRKTVMVFCDSTGLDQPRKFWKEALKKVFFYFCDGFFCYGQRSREYLIDHGVPAGKIFIRCQAAALPPGYDPSDALKARSAVLEASLSPTILYVGRFAPEKNLFLLLNAFDSIAKDMPESRLKLIGDGPDRAALENAALRLQLSDKVVFAGGMSGQSLYDEYTKAGCLVLPSSSEPWGLVVNEALSFGCPVVVSENCGCIPELVIENATGFKFRTFEVEHLAKQLKRALSSNFNTIQTAQTCIRLMEEYQPEYAAAAIVSGMERTFRRGL